MTCNLPNTNCSGSCVNTQNDPNNCGSCGHGCPPGAACALGTCMTTCMFPFARCGGTCVDPLTDPLNCGACGNACAPSEFCQFGTCQLTCTPPLRACGMSCTDFRHRSVELRTLRATVPRG